MNKLTIGTRGSRLARAQAAYVAGLLRKRFPSLAVDERIIVTEGDKLAGRLPSSGGDKGLFTRAIEAELLERTADIAVHSYKDLPTELPHGLCIGAVLERGPVEDALVGPPAATLESLPAGCRIGVGGIRRAAQVRRLRPDVIALPIQGNVDTRLKKLDNGDFDAIVLARAGLMRLDLGVRISSVLEVSSWYHAVGQGALAIEIREQDDAAAQAVLALDHALTRAQTDAERSFLGGLGGGCLVPVGVRGSVAGERLDICGMVCGWGGEPFLEEASTGHPREAKDIGLRLAEKLLKKGAAEVLKSVRERQAGL